MRTSGRAIAGVVVLLAAVLVLFTAVRAHGGSHPGDAATSRPSGAAGSGSGTREDLAAGARGTSTPPASSPSGAGAAAAHADPFAAAASAVAASRSGTVLAAVYDVRTGQTWRLGDGQPQAEASVVKVNILQALLARQGGAGLSPDDQSLAVQMIEDSDNDAATTLWDAAGGASGLTSYNDRAGLSSTTPSTCVACTGFPWPGWGLTSTLPQDQLTLLKQLVVPGAHPLLSAAARSYALSLMEHVNPDQHWGVSGGVPSGVTVALKNGWLPLNASNTDWQVNSVGWVSGQGRNYVIAVLSTGNPTEQYGIDTINALSADIWQAMR
jgi:beta-lactamase class A